MPLLEMHGIQKSYPGVQALADVDLTLQQGEVLALVGENGAGKSTLIKILGGACLPDAGVIRINGADPRIHSPMSAQQAGVAVIYQEFNLVSQLTVRENIFLGREKVKGFFIDALRERKEALKLFHKLDIRIDPDIRCSELTVGQQQCVEIAKALEADAKILVMDEPTAALTRRETVHLFSLIKDLKSQGMGIIYITHRLEEVFGMADRVMILRDGRRIDTRPMDGMSREGLIEMMVGRPLSSEFPRRTARPGQELLRVERLNRRRRVRDVSFHVRAGEVLGFAGLTGSGRTETMRLLFGADRPDSGRILVNGAERRIRRPKDAINHRICLLTENRKEQGLVLIHPVCDNFGLPNLDRFRRGPFVNRAKEAAHFKGYAEKLKIKISHIAQPMLTLSGGNQQKVVLAKWLERNADIIIFDEPTRGIDVGAKREIYLLINQLAADGKAIIMISSELEEVLGMSSRIMVMHEGRITGEIHDPAQATQEDIMAMAMNMDTEPQRKGRP